MSELAVLPTPDTMPFEAELQPIFAGFVRIAASAAAHAPAANRDSAFQHLLAGLVRSWREETRFMRRMRAFGPHPVPPDPPAPVA